MSNQQNDNFQESQKEAQEEKEFKKTNMIFYDWLFADDDYRKQHNPFIEMINQGVNTWPIVPTPKLK